jgi:hypothetical protein
VAELYCSFTILPGPFAEAKGLVNGTIVGDTKTDRDRSLAPDAVVRVATVAVPSSLIVLRMELAKAKSTAPILLIPTVGTVATGIVLPKAILAINKKNTCSYYKQKRVIFGSEQNLPRRAILA